MVQPEVSTSTKRSVCPSLSFDDPYILKYMQAENEEAQETQDLLCTLYANRAACHLHLNQYDECIDVSLARVFYM